MGDAHCDSDFGTPGGGFVSGRESVGTVGRSGGGGLRGGGLVQAGRESVGRGGGAGGGHRRAELKVVLPELVRRHVEVLEGLKPLAKDLVSGGVLGCRRLRRSALVASRNGDRRGLCHRVCF